MEELAGKGFDFAIRSIELSNYLEEEKKLFPIKTRLLECAEGICVSLRTADILPKSAQTHFSHAFQLSLEAECLLELMVKTGVLSETQSRPILTDCRYLKNETEKQLQAMPGTSNEYSSGSEPKRNILQDLEGDF